MPSEKENLSFYGVTVQTWGTKPENGNGAINFLDQKLFGGDVGHAMVQLKIPVTDQTCEWIATYCCDKNKNPLTFDTYKLNHPEASYHDFLNTFEEEDKLIPFRIKQQTVRLTSLDDDPADKSESGKKNAFQQAYFEIDFSWWPARLQSVHDDMLLEREGKHFEYADKWKEYLEPEQRKHKGKIGARVMNYAPSSIIHQRDLPPLLMEGLKIKAKIIEIEKKLKLINENLLNKMIALNSSTLTNENNESTRTMLMNIGINPDVLEKEYTKKMGGEDKKTIDSLKNFILDEIKKKQHHLLDELMILNLSDFSTLELLKNSIEKYETTINEKEEFTKLTFSSETIQTLFGLLQTTPTPYTTQLAELISEYNYIIDIVELENGYITADSVQKLSDYLNKEIEEKYTGIDDEMIKKYNEIKKHCFENKLPLEDALDEAGISKIFAKEIPERIRLSKVYNFLNENKNGFQLTDELENYFDTEIPQWKEITSYCDQLTPESTERLKRKLSPETRDEEIQLEKERIDSMKKTLLEMKKHLNEYRDPLDYFIQNQDEYAILGSPPDNYVKIPLQFEEKSGQRGLSPLAMLQKMHALATGGEEFDLYQKNCSLTSIEVLTAGAEHDPVLKNHLSQLAFNYFGTPQQVFANAEAASIALARNEKPSIFSNLFQFNFLDKALAYSISLFMDKKTSTLQKTAGVTLALLVGVAKLPFALLGALTNPQRAIDAIFDTVQLTYERNSTALKVVATTIAIPLVTLLAPFAVIQSGLQFIAKPFKWIGKIFSQKNKLSFEDTITSPVNKVEVPSSYKDALDKMAKATSIKIDANEIIVEQQRKPQETLKLFKLTLDEHPEKVVILSENAITQLAAYIRKNPKLNKEYADLCTQAASRLMKYQSSLTEGVATLFSQKLSQKPISAKSELELTEKKEEKDIFDPSVNSGLFGAKAEISEEKKTEIELASTPSKPPTPST